MSFPVLGVTGLPCSGKSRVAELLASGRVPGLPPGELLKADDMGHGILTRPDVVRLLRERFGPDAFASDDPAGVRKAIAARVFGDPEALLWLEGIVHPRVAADADAAVSRNRERRPVVMEAALLFTAGMDRRCDCVLLVEASFETRLRRARARGWDREELERRERRQLPLFEAAKNGPAREKIVVVDNSADADLTEKLRRALAGRI